MSAPKKPKKMYSPEQKVAILNQIEILQKQGLSLEAALQKENVAYSNIYKWKKQLAVGIKSSLRNGKPPVNRDLKKLEKEIEKFMPQIMAEFETSAGSGEFENIIVDNEIGRAHV